ncbi:MAG: ATP-binding protein [Acetobacteraceae bacterium]
MRLPRIVRTASFRLAALYVSLFTASVVVLGVVVFWTSRSVLEQQMRTRIEAEVSALKGELQSVGMAGFLAAVRRRGQGPGALDYLVQTADGARLAGDLPDVGAARGWTTLHVEGGTDGQNGPELLRALVVDLPGGGVFAVGDDLDHLSDAQEAIVTALLWVAACTALLGMGGGVLLSRGFLSRVDTISRTAEAIIAGDLRRRIPVRGTDDDLDRLAATLNHMLDRIGILMESLRQVSTDIAHDLRTPLSHLLQRLDTARSRAGSRDDYANAIDAAIADAEAILATFAALLGIAHIEAAAERADLREVDISRLTETVVDAFAPSAEEEGHPMTGRIERGIVILGDKELLTQFLVNLVENALRHTAAGTRIMVSLARTDGDAVQLAVEDRGSGIPAEERALVLRRFYRLEQSRTTPGNGLGLSLVAAIAHLHGAALRLEDAAPGLRVTVTFRVMRADRA